MNAEVRAMKTPAEQALSAAFAARARHVAGQRRGRRAARGCVQALRCRRAAAPARRGVEIHRPARADARGQSAGGAGRPAPRGTSIARRVLSGVEPSPLAFVDGAIAPDWSDLNAGDPGITVTRDCCALPARSAGYRSSARPRQRRCRRWSQHRVDGRRRRDARQEAATPCQRPIHLAMCLPAAPPRCDVSALVWWW